MGTLRGLGSWYAPDRMASRAILAEGIPDRPKRSPHPTLPGRRPVPVRPGHTTAGTPRSGSGPFLACLLATVRPPAWVINPPVHRIPDAPCDPPAPLCISPGERRPPASMASRVRSTFMTPRSLVAIVLFVPPVAAAQDSRPPSPVQPAPDPRATFDASQLAILDALSQHARSVTLPHDGATCPMPAAAVDPHVDHGMPTMRPDTASVARMPADRRGCVNPLGPHLAFPRVPQVPAKQ